MTETAVGYRRVSSDEQKDKYSIPVQIEQQETYAKNNDYTIVKAWDVSESAKEPGRKGFNEMLDFVKKHKIKHVLFKKADRSARNETDAATIVRLARTTDVSFHFIEDNLILNKQAKNHEFTIYMINAVFAALMPRDLSNNISNALLKKASMGHYPLHAPIGYKNVREGKISLIHIDTDKSPFIKRMFELYATGFYSYKTLAQKMRDDGFKISPSQNCTKRNVELILNNPIYMGDILYKGVRYEGKHKPIISRELFHKVQTVIKFKTTKKPNNRQFLFSGLFKCSHCGCTLVGELKKGKYIYYHCTGNKGGNCKRKYVTEKKLEETIIDLLAKLKLSDNCSNSIIQIIKEETNNNIEYGLAQQSENNKQIEILQKRLSRLLDLYTDGDIDKAAYEKKSKEWQYELDDRRIKQNELSKKPVEYIDRARNLLELCKNAQEWYLQADNEKKRELLKLLHSNFLYDGVNPHYELNPAFKYILELAEIEKTGDNVTIDSCLTAPYSVFSKNFNQLLAEKKRNGIISSYVILNRFTMRQLQAAYKKGVNIC